MGCKPSIPMATTMSRSVRQIVPISDAVNAATPSFWEIHERLSAASVRLVTKKILSLYILSGLSGKPPETI